MMAFAFKFRNIIKKNNKVVLRKQLCIECDIIEALFYIDMRRYRVIRGNCH